MLSRRLSTRHLVALASILTVAIVAMVVFARFPWHVERWYVEGAGPIIQGLLVLVTGVLPFSLAEWVEISALVLAGLWGGRLVVRLWRGRGERRAVLARAGATLWAALSLVLFLFYSTWGLSYARPRAEERLGWVQPGQALPEVEPEELLALGEQLVEKVNALYLELHGWPDAYSVTVAPRGLLEADRSIDRGYQALAERLGLHPSVGRSRGRVKPLLTSTLFSWLGIGGFYFPFTGEANIDADAPQWQQPHTMAHEKGHQRFMASENEANFYGFLACIHSDDPFVQYSGWLFAQRQVLFTLGVVDPWGFHHTVYRRYPGVQRDVNYAREFWARYEGPVSEIGDTVNDTYLRFNGVEGGIRSYSQSIYLVVEWLRRVGIPE